MGDKVYDLGNLTPLALQGFNIFGSLAGWKQAEKIEESRHWTISQWSGNLFRCRLSWNRDGQMCALEMAATNPEECVWKCLQEFKRVGP